MSIVEPLCTQYVRVSPPKPTNKPILPWRQPTNNVNEKPANGDEG